MQTDAAHLYLDTGADSPRGYEAKLWYDISGGLLKTAAQRQRFLGGGVCLWSDSYCSLAAECGGCKCGYVLVVCVCRAACSCDLLIRMHASLSGATCIGGKTPTSECAGGAGWMQPAAEDATFVLSAPPRWIELRPAGDPRQTGELPPPP